MESFSQEYETERRCWKSFTRIHFHHFGLIRTEIVLKYLLVWEISLYWWDRKLLYCSIKFNIFLPNFSSSLWRWNGSKKKVWQVQIIIKVHSSFLLWEFLNVHVWLLLNRKKNMKNGNEVEYDLKWTRNRGIARNDASFSKVFMFFDLKLLVKCFKCGPFIYSKDDRFKDKLKKII